MAGKYAQQTSVSVEKTKGEIESTLRRYGATSFGHMWNGDIAQIVFDMNDRRITFTLPLPRRDDPQFTHRVDGRSGRSHLRTPQAAETEWEQACRSSWRSLLLVIKATLEAVEAEIIAFEVAFLPYMMIPGGNKTVADVIVPEMEARYEGGGSHTPLALGAG